MHFSRKKFGWFRKTPYLCNTRTRQASPRCSNVRVVLFSYNEHQNTFPKTICQCAWFGRAASIARSDNNGCRQSRDIYPPAWILAEVLPFGVITNVFSNIRNTRIKKRIAQKFGLQVAPFESWLTIVTLTRNSCCHHARVWNKQNTIRPMIPNRMNGAWIALPTDTLRIYFDLCIIKYFLNIISPQNDMKAKLSWLFVDFPEIDLHALGFPDGWETEPLWR